MVVDERAPGYNYLTGKHQVACRLLQLLECDLFFLADVI